MCICMSTFIHTQTQIIIKRKAIFWQKKLRVNTAVAQKANTQQVQYHRKNPITITEGTIFLDLPQEPCCPNHLYNAHITQKFKRCKRATFCLASGFREPFCFGVSQPEKVLSCAQWIPVSSAAMQITV